MLQQLLLQQFKEKFNDTLKPNNCMEIYCYLLSPKDGI